MLEGNPASRSGFGNSQAIAAKTGGQAPCFGGDGEINFKLI
jgi:hypothetical protein